ncbi:Eukaryotic aspartyl protease family protein [Thalictrum thalictroides]|uniref:Eukaryotic aspartyl protease family protein n=1 Tax=Thalictrum thalictroides TaxID=46969 RepID=A0A7J6WXD5_THATH|nr:Eukaryotic aspartyl protease family protein [Thalictrum thalictroides]
MAQENFNFGTVPGKVNQIAGIIGLGLGPRSLIRQLGERVQNRFSHCLQPWYHGKVPSTDLVFGSDAGFRDGQQVSTLPLINHPLHYYLKLEDISIFGEKLRQTFPPEASSFDIRQDGSGGCLIDIGSPYTSIQHPIFEHVIFPLAAYFSRYELYDKNPDFHYCFKRKPEENLPFPSMILHFANGVDLEIGPDELIMDLNEYFCIAIRPQLEPRAPTITIGNQWHANYRFVYDLNAMTVSFAKENCDHFGQ